MFKDAPLIAVLITLFLSYACFLLVDWAAGRTEFSTGIVVDKQYKAEINTTGTGYGTTTNGQGGVIVTTSHDSEKFLLLAKSITNEIVTVECEPELYYNKEVGQEIEYKTRKGYFTGNDWSVHGVR